MLEWLTHNPIADLYGPHFLALYAGVILVTLLLCGILRSFTDPTSGVPLPRIPAEPDPYEIAYLRGGTAELARAVIFHLLQDGYLTVDGGEEHRGKRKPSLIRWRDDAPDPSCLKDLEREVYSWFRRGLTPEQLFQSDYLRRLERHLAPYEERLRQEQLLTVPAQLEQLVRLWCGGMLAIVGLGGYKLLIALSRGKHNVGFLVLLMIVGTVLLTIICSRKGRLSARGQDYLARLQLGFGGLRTRARSAQERQAEPSLLLLMSVFGVTALGDTPFDYYPAMFHRSSVGGSGGSFGSSCGSSCGGAGGGCGGGGCGGCGGG